MSDPQPPQPLDRLRGHFHTGETPVPRPDCLDADTVAALADGTLDAARRGRALGHVATCALCRRAVASVAEALADGPITHEVEIIEGRRRRLRGQLLKVVTPLAAAAALVLLLLPRHDNHPLVSTLRGPLKADTDAPAPIGPRATAARPDRFVWTAVAHAQRYRLRLYDAEGGVLWTDETSDTAAALPKSVKLSPRSRYFWKVEAQTESGRWSGSELVEFGVETSP